MTPHGTVSVDIQISLVHAVTHDNLIPTIGAIYVAGRRFIGLNVPNVVILGVKVLGTYADNHGIFARGYLARKVDIRVSKEFAQ